MDKNYFVQLTLGLYKVTEILPDREPLKYKIRDKANDILSELAQAEFDMTKINKERIVKDLSVLNIYFDIAGEQNWIDQKNFLVLRQGYINIREIVVQTINPERKVLPRNPVVKEKPKVDLDPRKKEIFSVLGKKGPMRLVSMLQYFPDVSKRTLRRDIGYLVDKKVIKRDVEGKLIYYNV